MKQFNSNVISLEKIADDYYCLSFTWNSKEIPLPGQFLTIRTTHLTTPLLRRPFALSSFNSNEMIGSIIFQKIGEGTTLMCCLKSGDKLDILGPLGNSFQDKIFTDKKQKHIVVAGGIGTGPMLFLADHLKKDGKEPLLIIGCRTSSLIPFDVLNEEISTVICTDDGSYGYKGTVLDYMKSLSDINSKTYIYCCGPEPMLKGCHFFSKEINARCIVSLEQIMACGVGACMGCTCETVGEKKYARVCKDGPVFKSSDVKWI